jgi:hypothetical protein
MYNSSFKACWKLPLDKIRGNHLFDAGCAGILLELGSRDANPLAAVMALAADFNDGFNGVVRWVNEPVIKGTGLDKITTAWLKIKRFYCIYSYSQGTVRILKFPGNEDVSKCGCNHTS